ncbi:MAG: LCP family protein [Lachnospiraceae bacterium]|nr:LCP family protein [Lachnospiraceae bacterium]
MVGTAEGVKNRKTLKLIIFIVELVIIAVMLMVVWKVFETTEKVQGPNFVDIPDEEIHINEPIKENIQNTNNSTGAAEEPQSKGYWNIALLGVDAVEPEQLYKGSRSDTMMIASINRDTGEIKLVSVYRDTYMNKGNDRYGKCNGAYSANGAPQTMSMLNMNLDLDITDFVTVNYQAVKACVDGMGGVYIDIDSEELKHINNYQVSIIRDTDISKKEYVEVTETGYQRLNGLQAAAYCRIRQTKGSDFKRAERQREVLKAMEVQAKQMDLAELTKLAENVLEYVYTNIDATDILELVKNVDSYSIVDEEGFPTESLRTTATLGKSKGSCVIPLDLEQNVVWLHEFLFAKEDYQVSDTVKECSKRIKEDTKPYLE